MLVKVDTFDYLGELQAGVLVSSEMYVEKVSCVLDCIKRDEFLLKLEGKLNEELSDMWQ